MGTIAEELQTLAANKVAIKAAISAKNPSVQPTDNLSQWPTAIGSIVELKGETKTITPGTSEQTIMPSSGKNAITQVILNPVTSNIDANIVAENIRKDVAILGVIGSYEGSSGGSVPPNDVVFRDYDGIILYSYSASETASLTSLPPLPTREGLTCQEWNWTLPQIKSYVASYGKCEIGATYTTDDGKTRIKLTIQDPKYSNIPIVFRQTVANGVKVNWGDGSADQTYSSTSQQTISHTYVPTAYPATYTITFEVTSGTMSFPENIMGQSGSQSISNPKDAWVSMIDEVNIGNNVTSIGNNAFSGCHRLTNVTIPNSVTNIGQSAFQYCSSLVSITIPSSVISIQTYQFQYCYSITSIMIPNSVTSIGNTVFRGCNSLASIIIPSSVTSIGSNVFYECYCLTQITIPSSVNSIGDVAFRGCSALVSIAIPDAITTIGQTMFYTCYSLASITMPSSVAIIGAQAFYTCYGLKTFDFRKSTSVPTLANVNAFQYTPTVKEIVVPDALYDDWIAASNWSSSTNQIKESIVKASESSLGPYYETRYKYVGESTWNVASIYGELTRSSIPNIVQVSEVEIGNGVTEMYGPFMFCQNLTRVTIPNTITLIGAYDFNFCRALTTIKIPDSVTYIGCYAFEGCNDALFDTTTIPGIKLVDGWVIGTTSTLSGSLNLTGVRGIGSNAFYHQTNLTNVIIPDTARGIGDVAFYECSNLTSVMIPDSVTNIGEEAFAYCHHMTSVTIGDGVTTIKDSAFQGCDVLTSLIIGDNVTSIGNLAFSYCSNLTTIVLPSSVSSIGQNAFENCSVLTNLTFQGKTLSQVHAMENYPWGISSTYIINVA